MNPCDPQSLQAYRQLAATIPAAVLTQFVFVGDADYLHGVLQSYVAAGVTHFMVINASPDPFRSLLVLVNDVFPRLTGRRPPLLSRALQGPVQLAAWLGLTRRLVPPELDLWKRVGL